MLLQALLRESDYLENPLTRRAYVPTDHSRLSCHLPKIRAQVSRSLVCHFALILRMSCLLCFQRLEVPLVPNDSGDVLEDELLSELTDNRTTRGTKLSVLQIILFPFLVNRGS